MQKRFLLITGLSGSGKTLALHLLEDLNFFCVDNLPALLLPHFAELCSKKDPRDVAVVVDVRSGDFTSESLVPSINFVKGQNFLFEILFLEAKDEILVRRFSETRRKHPLSPSGGVLEGIAQERKLLLDLRGMADKILDTSSFSPRDLREEIASLYGDKNNGSPMQISVLSFGYKYGIPLDADLVFDVRFLPNPYYEEELQELTGNDPAVKEYVLKQPQTQKLLEKIFSFLDFVIPQYEKEGKHHLKLAVGCTGGRHRSIVIANEICRHLSTMNLSPRVQHRDIQP
jgi:UPF0042 nucleotide-binding protein